jgi:hypothetical protein
LLQLDVSNHYSLTIHQTYPFKGNLIDPNLPLHIIGGSIQGAIAIIECIDKHTIPVDRHASTGQQIRDLRDPIELELILLHVSKIISLIY